MKILMKRMYDLDIIKFTIDEIMSTNSRLSIEPYIVNKIVIDNMG